MVRFSPSAALGEGPYGEGGPEEAQVGPGRAQDRGQRGGAQGEGLVITALRRMFSAVIQAKGYG